MTEITTTLRWRGNELSAGRLFIGAVWEMINGGWNAEMQIRYGMSEVARRVTEAAARSALELAAREALSDG